MLKYAVTILCLVTIIIGAGIGCAAEPAPEPVQIRDCQVEGTNIYELFNGKESLTRIVSFTVTNPNPVPITVDMIDWFVTADGLAMGAGQLTNDIYIPANTQIITQDVYSKTFMSIVVGFYMSESVPIATATGMTVPVWKTIGGVLPMDQLQPIWDGAPEKIPEYVISGSVTIIDHEGNRNKLTTFESTWTPSE